MDGAIAASPVCFPRNDRDRLRKDTNDVANGQFRDYNLRVSNSLKPRPETCAQRPASSLRLSLGWARGTVEWSFRDWICPDRCQEKSHLFISLLFFSSSLFSLSSLFFLLFSHLCSLQLRSLLLRLSFLTLAFFFRSFAGLPPHSSRSASINCNCFHSGFRGTPRQLREATDFK